jgi:hypothetical protein
MLVINKREKRMPAVAAARGVFNRSWINAASRLITSFKQTMVSHAVNCRSFLCLAIRQTLRMSPATSACRPFFLLQGRPIASFIFLRDWICSLSQGSPLSRAVQPPRKFGLNQQLSVLKRRRQPRLQVIWPEGTAQFIID